ncbi:acetylcholine receptor subunit alpha-type acr-16 [Trichonephila clavata]|uniref:Acetylcholine receptor subunit alpha-type acr-16 n=1 Tax=Trichonephila clavata TaxID=2740835 RepID=A0A8X6G719_TRICU|nr:acetylcholine receptor subunit alpha-type acr-16 [Trichonephila clavata]
MTEKDLRRYLFADYDKLVRPVKDPNNALVVYTSITPLAITKLDEVNQILVMDSWMLMKWKDDYLTWEPKEFNNITILRIPHAELWKPDLSIYTSTPDDSLFPTSNTRALIYSDGTVVWVTPFTIKNRCPRQKKQERSHYVCNIRIGSWTYSANLMDVQLSTPEVDLSDFQDTNTKWKLMTAKMNRESKYYPCCVEGYPLIHFNITLKRRFL